MSEDYYQIVKEDMKKYKIARSLAITKAVYFIQLEARRVLRKHPRLDEFVMAMGVWFFTLKSGDDTYPIGTGTTWFCVRLAKFIEKWDDELHLTGIPMRFTAEGPVISDW